MFGFGGKKTDKDASDTTAASGTAEGGSSWSFAGLTSKLASLPGQVKEGIIQKKNEFQQERSKYEKKEEKTDGTGKVDPAETEPYWKGCLPAGDHREAALQELILKLSCTKDTFMSPPTEHTVQGFLFDHVTGIDECERAMHHDPRLSETRYILVPRRVKEPIFWANYFHHVHSLRQQFRDGVGLGAPDAIDTNTATVAAASPAQTPASDSPTTQNTSNTPVTAVTPKQNTVDGPSLSDDDGEDDVDADADEFISDNTLVTNTEGGEPWLNDLKEELGISQDKDVIVDEYAGNTDEPSADELRLLELEIAQELAGDEGREAGEAEQGVAEGASAENTAS